MSQHATYLGQRLFISKVIGRTHRHTHAQSGPIAQPGPLNRSVISAIVSLTTAGDL